MPPAQFVRHLGKEDVLAEVSVIVKHPALGRTVDN
jgi:hypothetical protein